MRWKNLAIFEDDVRDKDWAFFCRYNIYDQDGNLYLRRWRLFQTPWFGVFLHRILRPDLGRDPHDHPWNFTTIVLRNGYVERTLMNGKAGRRRHRVGTVGRLTAEDFHIIERFNYPGIDTWTLFFTGKRRKVWGFLTEDGWVPHNEYEGYR